MATGTDPGPRAEPVVSLGVVRRVGLPTGLLADDALLAGYRTGDEELTVAFVRRFQSRVFGVALAVTGDRLIAEAVAQQAFERAWRQGSAFDPRRGSVASWLSTITRNLAIDALRVRRPVPVDGDLLLAQVASAGGGPEAAALDHESAAALRAALHELPVEQARAVVLAGITGLSASEVAEREGIPLGTAKTRIRSALRRLRASLEGTEADRA